MMSEAHVGFSIEFPPAVLKAFENDLKTLKKKAKKGLRTGVTKSGRVLNRSIKTKMPLETKLMKKSIGSKVKTYKNGTIVAIIGVRKGFRQSVKIRAVYRIIGGRVVRVKKPRADQLSMIRNPEKYLHLVELGFTQSTGKHIPGKAPMRHGHAAVRGEMEQIIGNEFRAAVEA